MIKNFTNSRAADLSETKQDGRKWKKKNMLSKKLYLVKISSTRQMEVRQTSEMARS